MTSSRKPYQGPVRKLIVGIDVGTTFSGVSYCILDPGAIPIIEGVNRYPAEQRIGGDAKVPSVIYYDQTGLVRAVGAEALLESNAELAIDQQWIKAEWFKLHLRSKVVDLPKDQQIPPLPLNKTIVEVFGDFLRYLYQCTRSYIQETHARGPELWQSLEGHPEFVLSHPNDWEGSQQDKMRSAAIYGGLVPGTPDGRSRVWFVTEGEASLHYCIGNNHASDVIKNGEGVIIVDAGGGTIDLSAYYMKAPNKFEEIAPASCHFQGSVYVSRRAKVFLEGKLYNSRYGSPDDIAYITECFDKSTKLGFIDAGQPSAIKFGTSRDTDTTVDIKSGQLRMRGSDVAAFFEPSFATIRRAIQEQKDSALVPVTSVLLVGGFAANNWLFSNLQNYMRSVKLRFSRPDGHLGKAVADGAVSFFLDHFVSARVSRATFGTTFSKLFDPTNPGHRRRSSMVWAGVNGEKLIPKGFDVILAKGSRVSETTVFRRSYCRQYPKASKLSIVAVDIISYRGNDPNPQWIDDEPQMYSVACTMVADTGSTVRTLPLLTGKNGEQYFRFNFDVELSFGLTEFKAQICWKEGGEKKWSPAQIVYDRAVGRA